MEGTPSPRRRSTPTARSTTSTSRTIDALVVPGGTVNADKLRVDDDGADPGPPGRRRRKPLAVICHGPWLLVSAGLVEGRRLTATLLAGTSRTPGASGWTRRSSWTTTSSPAATPAICDAFVGALEDALRADRWGGGPGDFRGGVRSRRPRVHDLRTVRGELLVLDVEEEPGDRWKPRSLAPEAQEEASVAPSVNHLVLERVGVGPWRWPRSPYAPGQVDSSLRWPVGSRAETEPKRAADLLHGVQHPRNRSPSPRARRWWTAVRVSGTKTSPIPNDIIRMNGRRSVARSLPCHVGHRRQSCRTAAARTRTGASGEPSRGADAGEVARVDPVDQVRGDARRRAPCRPQNGRNATPASSGL